MSVYPEVPEWWYAVLGIVAFVIGLVVIEAFDTKVSLLCTLLRYPSLKILPILSYPHGRTL